MTIEEQVSRDTRMINNIRAVLGVHHQLCLYAAAIQVSIENTAVVLRGQLPTVDLKQALIPAIRQAGVLAQVSNQVQVEHA